MATHNNPQDQESWLTLTLERQSLAVRGEIVRSHQSRELWGVAGCPL